MKNIKKINSWFTLIEILVAVTIFSIMMIFVMMIFTSSTQLSGRVEINRQVQQNIKNIVETIAEDVRTNWIYWISQVKWASDCNLDEGTSFYRIGTKLCTKNSEDLSNPNTYYLATCDDNNENCSRVENVKDNCEDKIDAWTWIRTINNCTFIRNWKPLSNSIVKITDLQFLVNTKADEKKVTVKFTVKPRLKKWVWVNLIENSKVNFQTTISEKLIKSES